MPNNKQSEICPSPSCISTGRRSAFTLIELLVVIAIISLLASILLPSLNRAKDLAKRVTCQSNLKHQSIAFRMYASDWKGYIPLGAYYHSTGSPYWYQVLGPYAVTWKRTQNSAGEWTTDSKIYQCPSATSFWGADRTSSGIGYSNLSCDPDIAGVAGRRLADIKDSAGTGMVMDIWPGLSFEPYMPGGAEARAAYYHNDGNNILFADGHIGWHVETEITEGMFTLGTDD
ncbi:MAG: prepilin-type N-terminal cleavage/methylation domain-containing protein [Phycisphaerae bacterium]|nr:prepilin-type N-terminal cleavage/methylation domain-containing protein [Phycisphaerae bacterium]